MSCLVAIGSVCLLGAGNLAIDGSASWQVAGDVHYAHSVTERVPVESYSAACLIGTNGCAVSAQSYRSVTVQKPYSADMGRLGIYNDIEFSRRFSLRLGIEHTSMIESGDRGEERAMIGFSWRPFR